MSQPVGSALLNCIRENGKFEFEGIRGRSGNPFHTLARTLSIPWHHIYYAEHQARKQGQGDREMLLWFLVHILYQSASGHLRTDLTKMDEDLESWCSLDKESFQGNDREYEELTLKIKEIREDLAGNWEEITGNNSAIFGSLESLSPFIFLPDRKIVYLRNFYKMERSLLEHLDELSRPVENEIKGEGENLFDKILTHRLVILSGGPGTGKTTAVSSLLKTLQNIEGERHEIPLSRIFLAAPTGRAANRMIESMRDVLGDESPVKAYTLHKLLRVNRDSRGVYYNKERPIPADLIIIDEASMVDVRMMTLLFEAIAPDTTLLLVGDRDQLPSVDAGAVFSDFVAGAENPGHKLHDNTVFLKKSWRSSSGILAAAQSVITSDSEKTMEAFQSFKDELILQNIPEREKLIENLIGAYGLDSGKSLSWKKPEELFRIYERTAVLIPTRKGPFGVESLNRAISGKLAGQERKFYHGQPIMILSNDYNLSLFNGDRGVIVREKGEFLALFRSGPNSFRTIPAGKINLWETAFCQTVHKSQGSEYDEVIFLIPEGSQRLLTREIVYTGITRARKKLKLYSSSDNLKSALSRKVVRHSGIREYLGGNNHA